MSQEPTTTETRAVATRPGMEASPMFEGRQALSLSANVGAIAIEQERAIAETQGKLILAKRFPRSITEAYAELMIACKDPAFAETAFYSVPNRGSGASIRFAEEVGRCYGNFDYGHRELSREIGDGTVENPGKSEVEVYAWDMEKNNYSRRQITVLHVVDTKQGPRVIRDQADIDNRIANIASKQVRGRILAIVSKTLVAAGIAECKKTLAGGNEKSINQRIMDMVGVFAKAGVTTQHLETYLGHKVDATNVDELADLRGVLNALKEGAKVSDFFNDDGEVKSETTVKAAAPETKKAAAEKAKETQSPQQSAKPADKPAAAQASGQSQAPSDTSQQTQNKATTTEAGGGATSASPTDGEKSAQKPQEAAQADKGAAVAEQAEKPAQQAQQADDGDAGPPDGPAEGDMF